MPQDNYGFGAIIRNPLYFITQPIVNGIRTTTNPHRNTVRAIRKNVTPGTFGGGSFGGGGAGGRQDSSGSAGKKEKDDWYNIREQRVVVNGTPTTSSKPKPKQKPKQKPRTNNNIKPRAQAQSTQTSPVIIQQEPQIPSVSQEMINVPLTQIETPDIQVQVPVQHYNRKTTRHLLRAKGYNPYHVGSLQRRQLRKYLNGELTEDQISPTVRSYAEVPIVSENKVFDNYYKGNRTLVDRFGNNFIEVVRPTVTINGE